MKVDGSLKSLLQGVSQQPPRDRLPGQCTAQENMSSDPVTGLTRRPPTDLVEEILVSDAVQGWHKIRTKDGNKFLMSVADGDVKITDLNGVEHGVTVDPAAATYINLNGGELGFSTVNDDTYIVNKSVIAEMLPDVKSYTNRGAGSQPQGIIQILGGQYNMGVSITMNGTLIAKYQPPDGAIAADTPKVRTTWIATQLATNLVTTVNTTSGANEVQYGISALAGADWTVTRFEDVIHIKDNRAGSASDAAIFTLAISDDRGNVNAKAATTSVPDTSDLPRIAPQGYVMRVATETDPEEDLWVQFQIDSAPAVGAGFGLPGAWLECVAPGVPYKLDQTTMPHVLEYDSATELFTIGTGEWADRGIGTLVSNPEPSFVGNTINDITTFQSRLVLLAGSFLTMSRTNRPRDFWLGSASALVDDDSIDISSTAVEASVMKHAVPHNRDLVIFSDNGQFIVFGRVAITPKNCALVLTTAFEADLLAKPVPAGRNVFFSTTFGRFAGMREFYTEGGTDINDTRPITQHIKKYLLGRAKRLVASSNYDILAVHTNSVQEDVYVYQFIWADNEKVQSSWSRWSFHLPVEFSFFDEELFYVVLKQEDPAGDQYTLYRMSLDVVDSSDQEFPFFLDARFDVTALNTQFTLPYPNQHLHELVVIQGVGCPNPGMQAPIESIELVGADWVVTLQNDMLGGAVVGGTPFYSEYRPTMPLVKDGDGVVMNSAKLRLRSFDVSIGSTGYIAGQRKSVHGDGPVKEFKGRVVGNVGNTVGRPSLYTGTFSLPFRKEVRAADFVLFSDSYLPMTILDIEWGGQYNKRGRRIAGGQG